MVKKNQKTSRLEKALDETLDRFLEKVKFEEETSSTENDAPGITLADGSSYILSPEEGKKLSKLAKEKEEEIAGLLEKAVKGYLRREQKVFTKQDIKEELVFWQKKLESLEEGSAESDLSPREKKVLLSYLRQLARGTWEEH